MRIKLYASCLRSCTLEQVHSQPAWCHQDCGKSQTNNDGCRTASHHATDCRVAFIVAAAAYCAAHWTHVVAVAATLRTRSGRIAGTYDDRSICTTKQSNGLQATLVVLQRYQKIFVFSVIFIIFRTIANIIIAFNSVLLILLILLPTVVVIGQRLFSFRWRSNLTAKT